MKTITIISILMLINISYSFSLSDTIKVSEENYVLKIEKHRKDKDTEFKSEEKSPIPLDKRKKFKGLKYFPISSKYKIEGTFMKSINESVFEMKTSSDLISPKYIKYGEIHFLIDTLSLALSVYQNLELTKKEGYENYLFIPFSDSTNGVETYISGRYLDFEIPQNEKVVIDFNLAYNPYCSYNHKYSCPIPPVENYLPTKILAGEMHVQKSK